ncbi:putative disease resistance protein RGA3 [Syzygium oleosum]|uniref:putative disease resistance protein RGA3 n=1 Tax=Syzygium oleosum TaxID=219896 RepID=UPI0024BB9E31|nr:putative disease resistance protein RGA3 [Syzygium oleosum]
MAEAIIWRIAKILDDFAEEGKSWGIVGEFHKLKETVSTLQKVVRNAEKRSLESRGIKAWLDDLGDALHGAEDLLGEWNVEFLRRELRGKDEKLKQVNTLFSPSNELAPELKSIRKRIEAIAARVRFFNLLEYAKDVEVGRGWREREQSDPFVYEEEFIGRNGAKRAISKFLLDSKTEEKISVLSMWGMGGIGKTSLARCLYKDDMVNNHFDLRIWVCVGDLSDFKMVLRKIIESAATERADDVELEQLQNQLMEHIRGKKCLLVMDDVWLQFPQH